MDISVTTLDGADAGQLVLADEIYGLEPRADILYRVVRWQLAKRRAGTHAVKNRAEIWRTGKKMYKQKGTGNARHGSARANLFRGGGRSFGPVVRSHEHDLPKKVRVLGLKFALSSKARDQQLIILDNATLPEGKTKVLAERLEKLNLGNVLVVDGAEPDVNFGKAARNLSQIDVLPVQGINVYDILRHNTLVLTKAAVDALEERFK